MLSAVSRPRTTLFGTVSLTAATLGAGVAARGAVELIGPAPRVMIAALALPIGGGALVALLRNRLLSRRLGWAISLTAAPLALFTALTLPYAPALAAVGVLVGGAWALGARSEARGPLALLLGALALPLGFLAPVPGLIVAFALLTVLARRPLPDAPPLARPDLFEALAALSLLGAAALLAGAWTAGRARLDPTPFGAIFSLSAALAAAAFGAFFPRGERSAAAPLALSIAALALLVGLGALPRVSASWIHPLAGEADPRLRLALLGAALVAPGGLAAGVAVRRWLDRPSALPGLAIAVGLWWGADTGPDLRTALLALAGAGALGAAIAPGWGWRRLVGGGALVASVLAAALAPPWAEQPMLRGLPYVLRSVDAPSDIGRALEELTPAAGGWGPDGAALIYTRGGNADRLYLDGLVSLPEGREADAEALAGHLSAALAARAQDAIVLGDARGRVTRALLTQRLDSVQVLVPDPDALRALAAIDPEVVSAMLHPSVRLQHAPPELMLRRARPVDVVVEVAQTPWLDGHQGLPGRTQLALRRARLRDDGVYLLVVPVARMEEATFRALLDDFRDTFEMTWAFLPPQGADQVLIAGWRGEWSIGWGRFVEHATFGLEPLARLRIRSAVDLADRALIGPSGIDALAGQGGWLPDGRVRLAGTLHRPPRMLLPLALPHVADPGALLDPGTDPAVLASLEERAGINRDLLRLLQNAAEGDFKKVFEQSRDLVDDAAGQRALDPLVEPGLERARALIARGMNEGPTSEAWTLCLREAESLRMLNPRAAAVHATAAKCRLAQGDLKGAEADFNRALELERGNLEALLGLTQLHISRGELTLAEQRLREAVKYNPQSWRPRYHLGVFLLDLDRLDEALNVLAEARGLAGDTSALPYGALAHVQLRRDDPNAALVYAERAVAMDPTAKHLHLRGWAYMELGQLEPAQRDFQQAVLTDPNWWPAHADLGRIFAIEGEYAAAADAFQRVLRADPGNVAAMENLRRVQEKLGAERRGEPPAP